MALRAAAGGALAGARRSFARTGVEQDGDRVGGPVYDRDVDATVVVEVRRHHRVWVAPDGQLNAPAELAVASPRQDLDLAGRLIGIDQVDLAIAVEILGERWPCRSAQLVRRRRVELMAVAE